MPRNATPSNHRPRKQRSRAACGAGMTMSIKQHTGACMACGDSIGFNISGGGHAARHYHH